MKPLVLSKAQDQQRRVVLGEFLAMGDEVIVCRDARDSDSHTPLPPDGTRAWVIGFTTYFNYETRSSSHGRKPGIYRRYGAPVFQWLDEGGNEQIGRLSVYHLIWADANLDPQVTRRDTEVWNMHRDGVYVHPLPETPVVEGDIVRLGEEYSHHFPDGLAVVQGIDYSWNGQMDEFAELDGANIFRLSPVGGGFTMNLNNNTFTLEKRGNYYWYENDQQRLHFQNLQEKASFYSSLGLARELRNPRNDLYGWTLEEALSHLESGVGAGLLNLPNPFARLGEHRAVCLHLYDFPTMPELTKEIREATLKGFDRYEAPEKTDEDHPLPSRENQRGIAG